MKRQQSGLLHADFLLSLLFIREDGGNMSLQNASRLYADCMA
jgi:hypothetical protein